MTGLIASLCLTCPSSSLRSEVLTSAPSLISGSKKSLSQAIKKDPKNFCISTVTYMETGMMKLKSTMNDRKSVNTLRYWWTKIRSQAHSLRVVSWTRKVRNLAGVLTMSSIITQLLFFSLSVFSLYHGSSCPGVLCQTYFSVVHTNALLTRMQR